MRKPRMQLLLFGKNGQIGRELRRTLLPFGEVAALGRDDVDLCHSANLQEMLERRRPEVIVNAAAYTAVDRAESDEDTAYQVNAEAVGIMAEYARRYGSLLIHYSTDYVFDGTKQGSYDETDAVNPQSAYGRSKQAGEARIVAAGCRALLFRTSWVFSARGGNFIKTILRLAAERTELNIVADQFGAPTAAELIADVTALALWACRHKQLSPGIYHLAAAGETSWHGFAEYVVRRAINNGADSRLRAEDIKPIATEAYPLPARRPKNSRLNTAKISQKLALNLPDWKIHAGRVVEQLTKGKEER